MDIVLQNYIKDKSIPLEKRRAMAADLDSGGIDEKTARGIILQKYGNKYDTSDTSTPKEKLTGAAAGLVKTVMNPLSPDNVGKLATGVANFSKNMVPEGGYTPEQQQEIKTWGEGVDKAREAEIQGTIKANTPKSQMPITKLPTSPVDVVTMAAQNVGSNWGQNTVPVAQEGLQKIGTGAQTIASTFDPNSDVSMEERSRKPMQGLQDIINGALGVGFSPVAGAVETLPEPISSPIKTVAGAPNWAVGEGTRAIVKQLRPDLDDEYIQKNIVEPMQTSFNLYLMKNPNAVGNAVNKVAKGTAKVGKVAKSAGEKLYDMAIKPTVKEAELMQKADAGLGIDPLTRARTAIQTKKITGSEKRIGQMAVKKADELYKNTIAPAIKGSKEAISRDELFQPIIAKIDDVIEPGRKAELQKAFEAIKEEYASPQFDRMSLDTAQKIKRGLDEFTPQKAFKGEEIGSAYNQLRNDMADSIRQLTYSKIKDINIRDQYLHYGNLRSLAELGVKARTQGALRGGFGAFWSKIWDMAATPITTRAGRTLYQVGNGLEFVGPANLQKFSDFMKTKGITQDMFNALILSGSSYGD